ncbi:MAG TPA: 4Fe-4S binding protein [Syntrophorhabdales bacterium]|nr:4Fe-4S binding protein [Syntrophorhabdales bacterium]
MCEFCHEHGEGKKWYLQAKNYSEDLMSDVRRRKFIEEFVTHPEELAHKAQSFDRLAKTPRLVRSIVARMVSRKMKKQHFGQVVPIEEIEQIFGFVNSIVRMDCICRHRFMGKEKRYCYGVSMAPNGGMIADLCRTVDKSFYAGPDTSGFETVTKEEAISALRDYEKEGLCHTVWTFQTPFIAGVCNCDRADCLAMRSTVTEAVPVMFRGEYVAEVNPEDCSGCRQCMRVCQFGAMTHSASSNKTVVDQRWCYGCGVCRSACNKNAIKLTDRSKVPAVASLW